MCILIAKQAGIAIQEKILERCFNANPDGAGFCVEIDNKLQIFKGYFTFASFMDAFQPYEQLKAIIHFRIKTHGPVVEENCHPFYIQDDLVFGHNGIISKVPNDAKKSDTRMFKELYLKPLVENYGVDILKTPQIQSLIEDYIGASKLVMMKQGEEGFIFFNKRYGNESKEGIWFSNYSWQEPKPLPVYNPNYDTDDVIRGRKYTPPQQQRSIELVEYEIPKLQVWSGTFSFGSVVKNTKELTTPDGRKVPIGALGEVERVFNTRRVDVDFYEYGAILGIESYNLEEGTLEEAMRCVGWGA